MLDFFPLRYYNERQDNKVLRGLLSYQEIIEFIAFISTHNPSEEEAKKAIESASSIINLQLSLLPKYPPSAAAILQ